MARARFPGFSPRQVEEISELLKQKQIRFEVFVDLEAYQNLENTWKQEDTPAIRGRFNFDPHHVAFDIESEDLPKLLADDELKRRGFLLSMESQEPAFENEDYLCVHCHHHQETAGYCPTHHEVLVTFSEWNQRQKDKDSFGLRNLFLIAAAIIAVIVFFIARS